VKGEAGLKVEGYQYCMLRVPTVRPHSSGRQQRALEVCDGASFVAGVRYLLE
jgi:hypothetical protein